jgi:hypothetical protein
MVGLVQTLGESLNSLSLFNCILRGVSLYGNIFVITFVLALIDILGLEYFLIDPRVIDIILLVLVLYVFIMLLVSAYLVGLAVLL